MRTFFEDASKVVVLEVEVEQVGGRAVEQHALVAARRTLPHQHAVLVVQQGGHVAPLLLLAGGLLLVADLNIYRASKKGPTHKPWSGLLHNTEWLKELLAEDSLGVASQTEPLCKAEFL